MPLAATVVSILRPVQVSEPERARLKPTFDCNVGSVTRMIDSRDNNNTVYVADFNLLEKYLIQKAEKYFTRIQKYASDVNKEVQEFQGNVQKVKLDAELFMVRAAKFQKQYDDAFMMLVPKQQQQPQGRRTR